MARVGKEAQEGGDGIQKKPCVESTPASFRMASPPGCSSHMSDITDLVLDDYPTIFLVLCLDISSFIKLLDVFILGLWDHKESS